MQCPSGGTPLLTLSSMQSMTTEGYFLVSQRKNAGTPMAEGEEVNEGHENLKEAEVTTGATSTRRTSTISVPVRTPGRGSFTHCKIAERGKSAQKELELPQR